MKCVHCSSKIGKKSIKNKKCGKCGKEFDSWDIEYMKHGELKQQGN